MGGSNLNLTVIGFWGAYPNLNEPTSGYLLRTENQNILIDCGSGVLSNLERYINTRDLDSVIISHEHSDHCADLICLIYNAMIEFQLGIREKRLKIYAPISLNHIRQYCDESYSTFEFYGEKSILNIENVSVRFSKNVHPVESYAMSFVIREKGIRKKITYSGDTQLNDDLINLSDNSDLLVCECSLYENMAVDITGHMSSVDAGMLAFKSNSKRLLLTHLPHFGDHELLLEESGNIFNGKLELARCGLNLEI